MKYSKIVAGRFVDRPNRFIAHVEVEGRLETVHVKNTGRCKELLLPGVKVILEDWRGPEGDHRKTKFDLVAVYKVDPAPSSSGETRAASSAEVQSCSRTPPDTTRAAPSAENQCCSQTPPGATHEASPETHQITYPLLINMDSQAPNKVMKEWLDRQGYGVVHPEYTYGKSRIDFYLEEAAPSSSGAICAAQPEENQCCSQTPPGAPRWLVEVKGCTLERGGIGFFPDAPTERGVKHLEELAGAVKAGFKCAIAFVIQMDGIKEVRPNIQTHPEFGTALEKARQAGVEVWFMLCHVTEDGLVITEKILG